MSQNRQRRSPQFKAKLAVAALRGEQSLSELATEYDIDPRQITRWKNLLLDGCESLFVHKATQRRTVADIEKEEIRRELNETLRNVEYLKKKLGS